MPTLLGKEVGSYGFGLMGLTWRPTPCPEEQAFAAMRASLSHGANFWNGGDFYGTPKQNSLTLLKSYFEKYPDDADKIVLSIKSGLNSMHKPDGSRENLRNCVENCISMIGGKKKIDIFEMARVDREVPIEETVGYLAELVKEGKIGGIALSEVSAQTIRRAAKVHPIVCVEVEGSMFSLDIWENGVAEACKELGIPIAAYSPLGRGMLTGKVRSRADIPEGDMRRHFPRYSDENFVHNLELVKKVEALAKDKGCTPAQLSLAWVKHMGDTKSQLIIPIPGATTEERVNENFKMVTLDQNEFEEINHFLEGFETKGDRYHGEGMKLACL